MHLLPPEPIHWFDTNTPGGDINTALGKPLGNSTCAIVGGGHGLLGGGFGDEIDAHDVVVRVNRLQRRSAVMPNDLGRRQDLYVLDRCGGPFSHPNPGWVSLNYIGGHTAVCNTHAETSDAHACPFRSIVLKGNTGVWEHGCVGETQRNDHMRHAARGSKIPWGIQTDDMTNAAYNLRHFDPPASNKPTTGMHAVVMLGLACRSVHLYGFAGSKTVDGHEEDADHDIEAEHRLLRQLVTHTANMPPILREVWKTTNVSIVC